jgi:hypothetical protein
MSETLAVSAFSLRQPLVKLGNRGTLSSFCLSFFRSQSEKRKTDKIRSTLLPYILSVMKGRQSEV